MIDHSSMTTLGRIRDNFGMLVIITLAFVLVGVGVSLVLPRQYRVDSRLVLIQSPNPEIDFYTSQRSVEANVALLIDLAYTDEFFSKVVSSDVSFRDKFPIDDIRERRELFQKDVIIDTSGRGFINVITYDASAELADSLNRELLNTLVSEATTRFGEAITISTVDQPALYDGIGRPNILLNVAGSAVLGVAVGILYIITKKEKTTYEVVDDFGISADSPYEF